MGSAVYQLLERMPLAGALFRRCKYPLKRTLQYYLSPQTRRDWDWRIRDVLSCPDNQFIPRAPNAGRIVDGHLIMHNGLRILPHSYCGEPMRLMLEKNRGVHEPQEERVFMEVLKHMPQPAQMIELGSNWAFYSMWFARQITSASCLAIEPDRGSLEFGRQHFAMNGVDGKFVHAFVGAEPGRSDNGIEVVSVDHLVKSFGIGHIHILHSDIQGFERDMLTGAQNAIEARKIDYIFISTHSNELHRKCREFLIDHQYTILADADLAETYSFDGLLAARRSELSGADPVAISKKARFDQPVDHSRTAETR